MGGPSAHLNLDHNFSPYDIFKLMMSEDFRSGIFQESTNKRAKMEGAARKGDWDRKIIQTSPPSHGRKLRVIQDFFYLMASI